MNKYKKERFIGLGTVLSINFGMVVMLDEGVIEENRRRIDVFLASGFNIGERCEVYYVSGSGYGLYEARKLQ